MNQTKMKSSYNLTIGQVLMIINSSLMAYVLFISYGGNCPLDIQDVIYINKVMVIPVSSF